MIAIDRKTIKRVLKNHSWILGEMMLLVGGIVFIPFIFGMMGLVMGYWSGTFGLGMEPFARTAKFYELFGVIGLIMLASLAVASVGVVLMRRSTHYDKPSKTHQ